MNDWVWKMIVCVVWLQEDEDMGVAPTGGRASYTAPSDVMADLPPNEQVRMREGEGGKERGVFTSV